jgi:hypothetical protein
MKRLAAPCGIAALSLVLSCTSGDDVYISSKNSALSSSATCCSELRIGGTVDPRISDNAQARVAAQAISTVAGLAAAAVDELTTACRGIAQDLDADRAQQAASEALTGERERLKAWCTAAAHAIGTARSVAGGTITLEVTAPTCAVSARAKAACQAQCNGGAPCDVTANPPTCSGGRLTIACNGTCSPKGAAAMKCEGTCSGACRGACTSPVGVACAGKCEGTCTGAAQGGSGVGIKPDGTCEGSCVGTCEATAAGARCTGSCKGECDASCTGPAGASVRCDGNCDADFELVGCEGGKLGGGCTVDPTCNANCDALVAASAQCTPSRVEVVIGGAADVIAAAKLKRALERHLGALVDFKARLGDSAPAVLLSKSASALADLKAACVVTAAAAAVTAAEDVSAALEAAASVVSAAQ